MRRQSAFTLVELIVVMAIVALLASLLLPALIGARQRARSVQCVSTLKQWGMAMHLYAEEHEEQIPHRGQGPRPLFTLDRPTDWFWVLPPYLGILDTNWPTTTGTPLAPLDCPTARRPDWPYFLSYGWNRYLSQPASVVADKRTAFKHPDLFVLMADAHGAYTCTEPTPEEWTVQARHVGRASIAFLDGHVQSLAGDYIGAGKADPERWDVKWQQQRHE